MHHIEALLLELRHYWLVELLAPFGFVEPFNGFLNCLHRGGSHDAAKRTPMNRHMSLCMTEC